MPQGVKPTIDRDKEDGREDVLHWYQLYEQQKKKKASSEEMASILDRYVNRWQRWAAAGLQCIKIERYVYERIRYRRSLVQIER
jgi:hypothetical protein